MKQERLVNPGVSLDKNMVTKEAVAVGGTSVFADKSNNLVQ